MRGQRISLISAVCFFIHLSSTVIAASQVIVWKDINGISDADMQRVVVSPADPDTIYASTLNSVYRTIDGGKSWNEILSFRGTGKTINALAIAVKDEKIVFTGTDDGLFRSNDRGTQWKRIFRGIGDLDSSVVSISLNSVNEENIFIGTGSGLYRTDNNGKDWSKGRNLPAGSLVTSIAVDNFDPNIIYAATDNGLHKSTNNGIDWQRIFKTNAEKVDNPLSGGSAIETEETKTELKIKSIVIDPADSRRAYLGTTAGLLITEDSGLTWKKTGTSGLINRDIHHLAISSQDTDSVLAATEKGIFRYSRHSDNWHEVYNGMISSDIHFLALSLDPRNNSETLWAATKNGLFKTDPEIQISSEHKKFDPQQVFLEFAHEPTIEEVREAAIIYADVHPDKINKWKKGAAMKALLPDLRFEFDKNKSWQGSSYYYSGKYIDDDITKNKDRGWSVSLTWELGDLIWNNDQTSIDSRAKLMVELRDDILNEVTRLYFERRRMQIELHLSPAADIKERIDKALRLQELTADIDSLTGTFLSKRLAQIKKQNEL